MFCVILLNFMEIGHTFAETLQFFCIFLVKCKNSLDDLSYYGITLSKLEILEYNFVILHRYEHTIGDISCWENIIKKF